MFRQFLRFLTFAAVLGFIGAQNSSGQTIEAVLRAINLRQVYALGGSLPWPSGIPAFPQDGTITDLGQAIDALNMASQQYEWLQSQFFVYDPDTRYLANSLGSGNYLFLPRVGRFTVDNWRTKLRLLASGVDQLRAVPIPGVSFDRVTYNYSDAFFPYDDQGNYLADQDISVALNFPYIQVTGSDTNTEFAVPPPSPNLDLNTSDANYLFSWNASGGGDKFQSQAVDEDGNNIDLWQSGVTLDIISVLSLQLSLANVNQVISAAGETPPDGAMVMYISCGSQLNGPNGAPNYGQAFPLVIPGSGGQFGLEGDGDLLAPFTYTNIPQPNVTLDKVDNYQDSGDNTLDSYVLQFSVDGNPLSPGGIDINAGQCLFAPKFTMLVPASAKQEGVAPYGLGAVETNIMWLARVHLGRGKTDPNQVAWLTSRFDGFSSLIFAGSPAEFEVLYEDDPSQYTDPPIGGVNPSEPPDDQQFITAGFPGGWFEYYVIWSAPRLRQVVGGDIFVDISYDSSYSKTLRFYSASQVGGKSGKFYALSGQPFKTVVMENPTVDSSGLATDTMHLRINDSGEVYHEVVGAQIPNSVNPQDSAIQYTFSEGPTPGAVTNQDVIQISYGDGEQSVWQVTQTRQGVASQQTINWKVDPTFVGAEWAEMASMTDTRSNVARTTTCNWQASNVWSGDTLSQISYSGDSGWSLNNRTTSFETHGCVTSDSYEIAGGNYVGNGTFSDNERVFTETLGGASLRTTKQDYSNGFKEEDVYVDTELVVTKTFHDPSGSDGSPPWTLREADYPGGYAEKYSSTVAGAFTTTTTTTGWASGTAAGTKITAITNQYGGLVSRVVQTSEGAAVGAANGSNFTLLGAPQMISNIRGEQEQFQYVGSGANLGKISSATDWFGVTTSIPSYDWLGRPSAINGGFESLTPDYSDPLTNSFSSSAGYSEQKNFSPFGDLTAGSSSFGVGSSFSINPSGPSSSTVDGRTVSLEIDANGIVGSVGNGQGSRGGSRNIGADADGLFIQDTESNKAGGSSGNVVTTHYDALGRRVQVDHPSANGTIITDKWEYNDAGRTVTFTPGAGPLEQETVTTLSADGSTLTVTKGGKNYLKRVRSVLNGSVVMTTSLYDDSGGGGGQWTQLSSEAVDSAAGTTTFTPWDLSANAITVTETASHRGISGGLTNDSLNVPLVMGLPTTITGTLNGASVNVNASSSFGLISGISGNIGGSTASLGLDQNGRVTNLTGPGTSQSFLYGNSGGGFQLTMSDSQQGASGSYTADVVGDATAISSPDSLALAINTVDSANGRQTTINSSLTIGSGFTGATLSKTYPGLTENNTLNTDGSLAEASAGSGTGSASDSGTTVSVTETPNQRTTNFDGRQIVEDFYDVGLRKDVSGGNDARTETWQRGELNTESFTAGPWSGWEVDRVQDSQGRLGTLRVKQSGQMLRSFTFDYDTYSQLSGSHGNIDAVYSARDTAGRVTGLTRGSLNTAWGYNNGLLQSMVHTGAAGTFNFGFSYDSRRRVTSRTATTGVSWNSLQYTGISQLSQVLAAPARATLMTYGYDARGNRNSGSGYTQPTSTLDQVGNRTLSLRGFGVMGSVNPAAQVTVSTSLQPAGQRLMVDPQTGSFSGWWAVPNNYNNGAPTLLNVTVLGSLAGGGYQGATALSESDLTVLVPPVTESEGYDGVGRVDADTYWTYTWDSLGRLTGMVRKAGTSTIVGASGETLAFGYDCDGRRTTKTHTITYTNGTTKVETSQVLWSGWLPIAEQRTVNGVALPRRWFQWGADRSGTLEGAGGIGGLMAIQEEGGRMLLPIDDGLGNIIAVIDAGTGQAVASYWYGPFGEPLGENGDMTACPFRFQTKWYDYECQHCYFGYRHYDPVQGRWLSRDPMGEEGGFNLYAYCGNDPVNRWDSLGLDPVNDLWQGTKQDFGWSMDAFNNSVWGGLSGVASIAAGVDRFTGLSPTLMRYGLNFDLANNLDGLAGYLDSQKDHFAKTGWYTNNIYTSAVQNTVSTVGPMFAGEFVPDVPSTPLFRTGVASDLTAAGPSQPFMLMDQALANRLTAFKAWKVRKGYSDVTFEQFKRFAGAHRPNSAGETLYGNRSGFADWSRRVESTHGNIAGNQMAWLYRLETSSGDFLKWGVAENPATRFPANFLEGKRLNPIKQGPRSNMLKLERQLTESYPGPLNFEPWAGNENLFWQTIGR